MATSSQHSPKPTVAVVTVSYGSGDVLAGFLESVPAASVNPLAVVVADNKASAEPVAELAAAAQASYLPLDRNRGYGDGMNAGVASLPQSVEWVLLSNPDVILGAGSVDALVAVGTEDSTIGAVGPAIFTNGAIYPSARSVPSLRTGIGHALFANIWLGNPWTRAYRRDTEDTPTRRDAGWLSGACLLVRRSAFEQLGGFDPGFFMYFEDVDLGYRLGKAGYRNVYEPAATVTHSGAHSTDSESARMIAAHHDSARRFLSKKYEGWTMWPVRTALGVGLSIRSAVLRRRAGHH
jgi:N-acetylglucosaminyl-diphospho-decaprenol L-rhamnosyltransferase